MTPTPSETQHLIDRHLASLVKLYGILNDRTPTGQRLSPRELEIVTLFAATPLTTVQAGARLFLSDDTVKTHLRRAYAKLGITHRVQIQVAMASLGAEVEPEMASAGAS